MITNLTGNIEHDWKNCLTIWVKNGRIEDFPRNERRPKYIPGLEKILGNDFAQKYKRDYQFLISRLNSGNEFEVLCAFECLEYMCWEYGVGNVPSDILSIGNKLPVQIAQEVLHDPDASDFKGSTIGELFKHVFYV